MTLADELDGTAWTEAEEEAFALMVTGQIGLGIKPERAERVVFAAAAFVLARRAATYADLERLHRELFDVSADLRAFFGVKAERPPLRLVGGTDA